MGELRVLYNADVRTMDDAESRTDALAWRDGSIVALGAAARSLASGRSADAGGRTVLPGFIDAHHHPCLAALWGGLLRLSPPRVTDITSLQSALAAHAPSIPSDEWLVAMDWDELSLAERRPPTRAELDDAVPDRPVLAMHYSCHRAVANSRALEKAGIRRDTPDPPGGTISRASDGLPNGLLVERGMSAVESLARESLLARDTAGFIARLGAHHRALAEVGITRVVDATVPVDLLGVYREAATRGAILVPTIVMPVSTRGYLEEPWDALDGPSTGATEGALTFGPVKLVFDGAPGCAMCLTVWQVVGVFARALGEALRSRSLDVVRVSMSLGPRVGRDLKLRTGISIYHPEEARRIVAAASGREFAVATHAIGNDAVDVVLDAYETTPDIARAGRPRIEHASFLDRARVSRIAAAGAAVVTQPHLLTLPALASAPPIPALRYTPLRWLHDAGVPVAGSSDYPVGGFDPLDGIRAAVTRRTRLDRTFEPDQRIELEEALAMYTRSAADVCGCREECGTLEVGKRADLVVLDRPLSSDTLASARMRATFISGELAAGDVAWQAHGA